MGEGRGVTRCLEIVYVGRGGGLKKNEHQLSDSHNKLVCRGEGGRENMWGVGE